MFHYFCKKYEELNGTNNIYVAYSGGLDSRVLLELCHKYIIKKSNYTLQAIHINHGLNKKADFWEQHCIEQCNSLNIPIFTVKINLSETNGASLESLARQERRRIWKDLLPENGTLLLAHHAQDQAETILYRLFRGSGPTGLSGMKEYCKFGKGILLRPLLNISKSDIECFAKKYELSWIEDDSNQNQRFDRNFIRHSIIPQLFKRWPKIINNIIRSGELCFECSELVKLDIQSKLLDFMGSAENTLSIKKLLNLDNIKLYAVLRTWIERFKYKFPSRSKLHRIKQEVMLSAIDAEPNLNFGEYSIRRYRDDLYILKTREMFKREEITVDLNYMEKIKLTCGGVLQINKTRGEGIVIPDNSKKIIVSIGSKGKKAKKIFQQYGIPTWERYKYPLVFIDNKLVYISKLWVNNEFKGNKDQIGNDFFVM